MKPDRSDRTVLPQTPTVFISYAREDVAIATRLHADLRHAGVRSWLDVEDLLPGDDWRLAITQAIEASTYFLMLISSRSLAKRGFVQKELRLALEVLDQLPSGQIFIVPVRVEPCEPSEPRLKAINWVDLYPSYDKGLAKLLRGIAPRELASPLAAFACPWCGRPASPASSRCPTCGSDVGPPNVRQATLEEMELNQRYRLALDRARVYRSYERLLEFEAAADRTEPVLTITIPTLYKLLRAENPLYVSYLAQRAPAYEQVRAIADARLFPYYANDLRFGVLSLDGRGLARYGGVTVMLDERFVAHRATVTETDSVSMVAGHVLTDELPRGFRATWSQRAKLASRSSAT